MPSNPLSDPPPYDPRAQTQTVFWVQLAICTVLGALIFLTFCAMRRKFTIVYAVRPYRNRKIRRLPPSFFGWLPLLYDISPEEVLQVAGLDAYVFLRFFRMCVKILLVLAVLGMTLMFPLRWVGAGAMGEIFSAGATGEKIPPGSARAGGDSSARSTPPSYLIACTIFTYIFTAVVNYFLLSETRHIIHTRQRFLGSQKSLTDRTIMITNVPRGMRDETGLKRHIEELGVGKVDSVFLAHNYAVLYRLFRERADVVCELELCYARWCGLDTQLFSAGPPSVTLQVRGDENAQENAQENARENTQENVEDTAQCANSSTPVEYYPHSKLGRGPFHRADPHTFLRTTSPPTVKLGLMGRKVNAVNYYSRRLAQVDAEIRSLRAGGKFRAIPYAFVSMRSVTDAQMAAQALFSPNPLQLETCLAPAPFDVLWNNLLLDGKTVFIRKNLIELLCIALSVLLIIPIRYITSLLNVESIKKMWPRFGAYLLNHDNLRVLVTGVLPTYLFTIINTALPYCIYFLCQLQGLPSKGETELSVVRRNFLYIFFNLFLVFTLFGTITSYKALLTDTTKIAPLLAKSMKSLSLFYVDLIVLHGFTILPLQLLQCGDLFVDIWECLVRHRWQTPASYRRLFYQPSIFQVGLILPQHMMMFIITLIYSVLSVKMVVCGLIYFFVGYWVYKYQLVYSMVHPYHSTGKVWPIVFNCVCLGLFFLHLQMFGTLALEKSYVTAGLMIPLFPTTLIAIMYFKRNYLPLLNYIALDAIKTEGQSVEPDDEDDFESFIGSKQRRRGDSVVLNESDTDIDDEDLANVSQSTNRHQIRRKPSTIEEQREASQSYVYPCLSDPMNGPMAGFVGDYIDVMKYRCSEYGSTETEVPVKTEIVRKRNPQNEYD